MANKAAAFAHTRRGDEVILESNSHMFISEVGGLAVLLGLQARTVTARKGVMDPEDVRRAIRTDHINYPRTGLICVENPHTRAGHVCTPVAVMKALAEVARDAGVPLYVEGARIFNAAVALGVSVAELVADADSLMFSLSKGLGAPVGSILAGSTQFIESAYKARRLLGGSMRQAGVIAAAGIVALEKMVDRLAEDHLNAQRLAEGLAELRGLSVDLAATETNCVMFNVAGTGASSSRIIADLAAEGVRCEEKARDTIRFVTHKEIGDDDVAYALSAVSRVLTNL